MIWRNTAERYGGVSRLFHWGMAALVVGLLGLGLYMVDLEPGPLIFNLYFWHKSLGITVLVLVAGRLAWKLSNVRPLPLPSHRSWEKKLAKTAHFLLYLCLFVMPLTGWAISSAKNFPVSVFGWFTLPSIYPESKEAASFFVTVHVVLSRILIGLIVLHAAGAIKHHMVDKDGTLRRMLPGMRIALISLVIAAASGAAYAGSSSAPVWIIDPENSALTFSGTQMAAAFDGEFKEFDGEISFDPLRLFDSRVEIRINTGSITTNSHDRDAEIVKPEWFNIESFPESVFRSEKIEKTGGNQYVAHGDLSIRGVKKPVELPFTLEITTDETGHKVAAMNGQTVLQRLDFGIGAGQWRDTKAVGNSVTVHVKLRARQQ
ncbi:MAG: cytochrome b/b6 domain-containing protein [Proteobacteria bacterium]|nr:cytochrome b/b6 domain-containing protein [Pseudomonadota bacterium]